MPADFDGAPNPTYGPQVGLPRPVPPMRALERPPAAIPHVASRAVPIPQSVMPLPPMPKPVPPAAAARPVAPAPAQSTAVESPLPAPSTVGQSRPTPQILPTQDMPNAQDLEY